VGAPYNIGTYQAYGEKLADIPRLVRKWKSAAKKIAGVARDIEIEKAARAEMHRLLVAAGIDAKQYVTCNGYRLTRRKRAGNKSVDADKLRANGVAELDIVLATVQGKEADFVEVDVCKDAEVRAPRQRAA